MEAALAKPTPEERAADLLKIAKDRFRYWDWYYAECRETAAMVAGAQYGYWDEKLQKYIVAPETVERDVVRVVCNLEVAIVRQATGMLVQGDPIFGFYPGTTEGGDRAAAEVSDHIGRYLWRHDKMSNVLKRAAKGAFTFGMTPVLEEWNSADGEPFMLTAPPMPTMGADGELQMPPPFGRKGLHRTTVLRRDQLAFDPAAEGVYDGDALIIREEIPRSTLDMAYPGKVKSKSSRDRDSESKEKDVNRYSPATDRRATRDSQDEDNVAVYRVFVKTCAKYPFGKDIRVTADGDMLDEEKDNPVYPSMPELQSGEGWPNYHWPVMFYLGDEREGCPFGRGRVLDIHGLQKTFNGNLSKIVQHHAIIANTKVALPYDLDAEWDDEIGQVLRLKRGMMLGQNIGYLTPPSVPQDAIPLLAKTQELMEHVVGINAATMGNAPTADPSGRAIEGLQQRDYLSLDDMKRNLYETAAQHMEYKLRLFRRHADEPRKMMVVGENEQVALKFLARAHLASGVDVVAFNDTSLPKEQGKRIMAVQGIAQMLQAAPDERWRMAYLKLLQLHDVAGFFKDVDPHADRAKRVARRILLGEKPQYFPWDNPLAMKAEMDSLLCSGEFETKLEAEGGILLDPVTGMPVAKGPMGQIALALWQTATELATPAPPMPPGTVPGADAASPASTQAPPQAAGSDQSPVAQAA